MKTQSVLAVFGAYNTLGTTRFTFVHTAKVDRVESPAVASHPLRLLKTMADETAGGARKFGGQRVEDNAFHRNQRVEDSAFHL